MWIWKNKKLISTEMAMGDGWTDNILKAGYIKNMHIYEMQLNGAKKKK